MTLKYLTPKQWDEFQKELTNLINKHGVDNEMGIPDFILAEFIMDIVSNTKTLTDRVKHWKRTDHSKEKELATMVLKRKSPSEAIELAVAILKLVEEGQ